MSVHYTCDRCGHELDEMAGGIEFEMSSASAFKTHEIAWLERTGHLCVECAKDVDRFIKAGPKASAPMPKPREVTPDLYIGGRKVTPLLGNTHDLLDGDAAEDRNPIKVPPPPTRRNLYGRAMDWMWGK